MEHVATQTSKMEILAQVLSVSFKKRKRQCLDAKRIVFIFHDVMCCESIQMLKVIMMITISVLESSSPLDISTQRTHNEWYKRRIEEQHSERIQNWKLINFVKEYRKRAERIKYLVQWKSIHTCHEHGQRSWMVEYSVWLENLINRFQQWQKYLSMKPLWFDRPKKKRAKYLYVKNRYCFGFGNDVDSCWFSTNRKWNVCILRKFSTGNTAKLHRRFAVEQDQLQHPVQLKMFMHFILLSASVRNINDSNENSQLTLRPPTHMHRPTHECKHVYAVAFSHLKSLFSSVYHNKCWFKFYSHIAAQPFHVEFIKWYMKIRLWMHLPATAAADGQQSSSWCLCVCVSIAKWAQH